MNIEILRLIWWALLGVLFMGFAITDGFDLGAAVLFPFVARNEEERIMVLNTIKPFWEGNQVWMIVGAGTIFAAWPFVYAVVFSGAYFPILLLLLTMGISRPVSFKYRDKLPNLFWRRFWDRLVFIGGFVPAIIFGVLVGNILQGLPFRFDEMLRIFYEGRAIDLFNPFALWCGMTSLAMLVMHGGLYLVIKTEGVVRTRAIFSAKVAALLLIVLFAGGGVWVANVLGGYQIASHVNANGFSNPLHKEVIIKIGAWMNNYSIYPLACLAPMVGFLGAIMAFLTANRGSGRIAFIASGFSLIGTIGTVGVSMFPFILPSLTHPSSSLLVWDASSSEFTLLIMLVAIIIFLPIILLYTAWVYKAMSGEVIEKNFLPEKY